MSTACSGSTPEGQENGQISLDQGQPLLRTKLFAPPLRSNQITRPHLIEQIQKGQDKALILVSAPAGYGKTTLVSSWLRQTELRSAWLSLDVGDNDPARFLQYFLTALQPIVPGIGSGLLGMLQGMQISALGSLVNRLMNEIADASAPFVLVLDDFHAIHSQPILEMLSFLLEHMPPPMHLALLTRTDPLLPLSRLRVHNQMVEIRADKLRFAPDEIALFLNEVMGLQLSAGDITALEARTEGWIAGLQLAALSMQGSKDQHSFVSAFTGSHYYIMDYLAEEVLKLQPERVRSFLLQTSILDRMCGPLCDAVIEADKEHPADKEVRPVDGQAMLETLEQMNLFVIPLDEERRWFRYHHLFADVLNRRLELMVPPRSPELRRRASRWYEQNGFISEAIHQTLKAGDQDRAAQLIEDNGCMLLMSGELITMLKWFEATEFRPEIHPWLAIQKAWVLSLNGNQDQVEPNLKAPEQLLSSLKPSIEVSTMKGTIAAARAHSANMRGDTLLAADYAHQALELLPDCNAFSRSIRSVTTSILGDASWINGNLEEAGRAYAEAIHIGQAAGNLDMTLLAESKLADILMEQGLLQQAARLHRKALQRAVRPDGKISPLAGRVFAGLSRISYEWNQLEDTHQYVNQCFDLSQMSGDNDLLADACVALARLEQAKGNSEGSQEAMRNAEHLLSADTLSTRWFIQLKSDLARLWLAQGNAERANQFVQESSLDIDFTAGTKRPADAEPLPEIPYLQEPVALTLLRIWMARGDYEAALTLSERYLQKAETARQTGHTQNVRRLLEVLILQALAYQGKNDSDRALAVLERAISLAQPEGYVRAFLDEGEPMTRLLHQAQRRRIGAGFTAKLLAEIEGVSNEAQLPAQDLIEPLSQRELEVLKLIESGNSNQEIAAKLYISITTVKRHISNIYAKLGVKSRTQAVSLGRELKLFQLFD